MQCVCGLQMYRGGADKIACKKQADVQIAGPEERAQNHEGTTSACSEQYAVHVCNAESKVGRGPSAPWPI